MMKLPLRILCVCSTLERGGAENMIMNLYRSIDRDIIQFDFVEHTQNQCAFEHEIIELGGRIYRAPRYHIYNIINYKRWWKKHFSEHEEHYIVHGHFYTISSIYFKIAHEFKRITIGHSHIDHLILKKKLLTYNVEKNSDYCLACSNTAGKVLFPHKNFTVLRNAIDCSKFVFSKEIRIKKRQELNIQKFLVIGVVGRLFKQKNPDGIIEIFLNIFNRNENVRLLWVGDGELRQHVEKRIREYGLQDVVIMTGIRSDVNELLSAIDIYLMPSLFEGLPVSLIEAQASGLPCFCSDRITKEADITGLCHFLPLQPVDAWAKAILEQDVSKREDTLPKIQQAGYDVKTTAKWLEQFYLMICNQ